MPLQNRVDPYGVLFRSPARGTRMGNRGGAIHNDRREIVRPFKSQRWITCVLDFKDRRRTVMSPGLYTELFFLDEATAFSAGHRPCAECQRPKFTAFKRAWQRSNRMNPEETLYAFEMDADLHRARIDSQKNKLTWVTELSSLPNGSFVEIAQEPYLVWGPALLRWTPDRYVARLSRPGDLTVTVLTPGPMIECFREGYEPEIHESSHAFRL